MKENESKLCQRKKMETGKTKGQPRQDGRVKDNKVRYKRKEEKTIRCACVKKGMQMGVDGRRKAE